MTLSLEDRIELHELAGRYGDIVDNCNTTAGAAGRVGGE